LNFQILRQLAHVEVLVPLENKALIAVIDDDSRVLDSLQGLLESIGYTAASFSSAEAFLESRCAAVCRCVIADIGLPGMNGVALRRHLSVEQPDLPMILITAQRDSALLKEIDTCDGLRFFEKPFDTARLISAVATLAGPMDKPGAEI
jgi:FixJ family two-component response regulator